VKQAKPEVNPLTGLPYSGRFFEILERRRKLPAWEARDNFLRLIQLNQVLLLVGGAGSGKTTQLLQILLDAGFHIEGGRVKGIACTQPHRVAAMSAAQRISDELDVNLGTYIGYSVRFEDKSTPETLIKLYTDDVFLREMMVDPMLERFSVVMLDEAHEGTLASGVLCGLVKRALRRRPELKVVVMSAAVESGEIGLLQRCFDTAPVLEMPSHTCPVEIYYMGEAEKDYLKAAIRTVLQVHSGEASGDILLFLTSEQEVDFVCGQLRKAAALGAAGGAAGLLAVPLHASLPLAQQPCVFEPAPPQAPDGPPGRKVIIATQIAETSITVDGIAYVVDIGLVRQKEYNPRIRLESLLVSPISRSSAALRAAHAGRTRPGKCFRLYTENAFQKELPERTYPEILRSSLSAIVLTLKLIGIDDLVRFEYLDPPSPEALMRAIEALNFLGFLDDEGELTHQGRQAAQFPLDPQLAKMLIESPGHKCSNEALSIAALLSVPAIFNTPADEAKSHKAADEAKSRFAHLDGDHLTLLNVFHAYKQQVQSGVDPLKFCADNYINARSMRSAELVREHLKRTMDQLGLPTVSTDFQDKEYYPNIRRCLMSGFFMQVAHLDKDKYKTVKEAQAVTLHPSTVLQSKPDWVLYHEYLLTSRSFVRTVTQVRGEWLLDFAPECYDFQRLPRSEARSQLERMAGRRK